MALALIAMGPPAEAVTATGGNATNNIGGYRIHVFTDSATASNFVVTAGGRVELLVVGGGGGGGSDQGGGGGGGAVIVTSIVLQAGTNAVSVGVGGAGDSGLAQGWYARAGSNSMFGSYCTATGGSGGCSVTWNITTRTGGNSGNGSYTGGNGSVPQNTYGGGGGAGNSQNGESPTVATARAGNGGAGTTSDITGSSVGYGGGGGGGNRAGTGQSTATHGGGNGGYNTAGFPGTPNTGGGGGGGGWNGTAGAGAAGGSGVVIVRYLPSAPGAPQILNLAATNIQTTSAWLDGILVTNGDAVASVRLFWGETDGGNTLTNWAHTNYFAGAFADGSTLTTNLTGLTPGVRYYYRYGATNSLGANWDMTANFTTFAPPTMNTLAATNVQRFSAWLNGNLASAGGTSTSVRLYWGAADLGQVHEGWMGTNDYGVVGAGALSYLVTNLVSGQTYHYRFYATNYFGETWSATTNFLTVGTPAVTTLAATNILDTSAWLNGSLVTNGAAPADVCVYWGTNDASPSTAGWAGTNMFGPGAEGTRTFRAEGLSPDTVYVCRFYATNSYGENWGSATNFRTFGPPTVITVAATNVAATSGWLNGNLVSTGGVTAAVRVYWATNDLGPVFEGWLGTNDFGAGGVGPRTWRITNLISGQIYWYRYYATNSWGECWSAPTNFTPVAANGTWTSTLSGNWSDTNKWLSGIVADGSNKTASFLASLTAPLTVTLDIVRTVGYIRAEDAVTPSHNWTIAGSSPNILVLSMTNQQATVDVVNQALTISAPVAGGSGINKTGAGELILSNNGNTFSGGVTLNAGVLRVNAAGALGTGTLDIAGGAPQIWTSAGGGITISGRPIRWGVNFQGNGSTGAGATALNLGTGTVTVAGSIMLTTVEAGSTLTVGGIIDLGSNTLTVNAGSGVTFGGKLTGTGGGLSKSGSNTLTLTSASSDYTGGTTLGAGAVNFANGSLGSSGSIVFAGPSTLLWGSGNVQDISGRLVINDGITGTLDVGANNVTFAAAFGSGGSGALAKTGSGTLTLGAANSFNGLTTIAAGKLAYGIADALGAGAVTVNGGTLDIASYNDSVGAVTLTAGQIIGSGGILTSTAGFTMNNAGAATVSARLAGGVALDKSGAGVLTLSGNNSYSGGTTIGASAGGISFGLNGLGVAGAITFAGNAPLQWAPGNSQDISSRLVINNGVTATFDTGTNSVVFASSFGASGTGAVAKTGVGTLTFGAANTYKGMTAVSAGILRAAGDQTASSEYSIGNAGTLDIGNAGAAGGALTVSRLTLGGTNSSLVFEFNATPTNDTIAVATSGGLTITGGKVYLRTEAGADWGTNGTYNLVQYSGPVGGGGLAALTVGNPVGGKSYFFSSIGGWLTVTIGSGMAKTWDGGDADDNWGSATNWTDNLAPSALDSLAFAGSVRLSPVNNLPPGTRFNGIAFSGSSSFNLGGNAVNLVGNVVNNNNAAGGQTISLDLNLDSGDRQVNTVSGTVTISGRIGETGGSWGITKGGSGQALVLSGANTYTGPTTVNEGTLRLGAANSIPDASSVNIPAAGILDLVGFSETVGALSGAGTARITNSTGASVTLTVGANGGNGIWDGQIVASAITLEKDGAGTQVLTGTNTPTGGIKVRDGTLTAAGRSSLGVNVTVQGGGATALRLETNNCFASGVSLAIMPDSGKVYLAPGTTNFVARLYFGATSQSRGTWGATGSGADYVDDTHFAGSGVVMVGTAGNLTWDGGDAGSDNWSSSVNWVNDIGPANPTTGTLTFWNLGDLDVDDKLDFNNNVNIADADWQIGGLTVANSYGRHTTELAGHTLTVVGGVTANVGNNGSALADARLQGGNVRIGSEAARVSLLAGSGNGSGRITQQSGTFTGILSDFSVGNNGSHYGATPSGAYGTLDFSGVGGGTLDVTSLVVGVGGGGNARVFLGSNWTIRAGTPSARVVVNVGHMTTGGSIVRQTGALIAGTGGGSVTIFASQVRIGCGLGGVADFHGPREITNPEAKGTIDFGGITGPVTINATTMDVGYGIPNNGLGIGVLNLGGTTNLSFDVGQLTVGNGGTTPGTYSGGGQLLLGAGTGTVGTASLGGSYVTMWAYGQLDTTGYLVTYGTRLQITNSLTLADYGGVTNYIGRFPAGLDFPNSASAALAVGSGSTIGAGRGISLVFTGDPPATVAYTAVAGEATGVHWGLRWKGNHAGELTVLLKGANAVQGDSDDQLRWNDSALKGEFAGKVGIFYDAGLGTAERPFDTTYVGFYTKPQPGLTIMNGPAPAGENLAATQAVVTVGVLTNGGCAATGFLFHDTVNRGTNLSWSFTNSLGALVSGTTSTGRLAGLTPGAMYYFMAYATNTAGQAAWGGSAGVAFRTVGLLAMGTLPATNVQANRAWLNGYLTNNSATDATVRVYWDTTDRYPATAGWAGNHDFGAGGGGARTWLATGLTGETAYVCRFYATNTSGWSWGDAVSFTTMKNLAIVNGAAPSGRNLGVSNAVVAVNLVTNGGADASCYLFYGTNNPGTNLTWSFTNQLGVLRSQSTVESVIGGLSPGRSYYFMAYAANAAGQKAWGGTNGVLFRTIGLPVVTILAATNLDNTSAWISGSLVTNGAAPATVWAYWGLADQYPSTSGWTGTNDFGAGGEGTRTCQATGLAVYTTYYVRYYATNLYGETWSAVTNFRTLGAPVVNTLAATNVTDSSAWLNGNLASNGAAPATVRAYWGLADQYPSTSGWMGTNEFVAGPEGARTCQAAGLASNTTYVCRFYATNMYDQRWGAPTNFTTFGPPTIQTLAATNVQSTSAWLNGNLASTNGAPTTVLVYWGTTDVGQASAGWAWTNDFGVVGAGNRTWQAGSLSAGATYWYRYRATSSYGECWGAAESLIPGNGGSLTWDGEDASDNWSAGPNWSANEAPANPTGGKLTFGNTDVGGTNTVDADWAIGALDYAHNAGQHTTYMDGHSLTVLGNLNASSVAGSGVATLRGGTLRIGRDSTARGSITVGAGGSGRGLLTQADGAFAGFMSSFRVACNGGQAAAEAQGTVDFSGVAGGTLDVNEFAVASDGQGGVGTVRFGSNWTIKVGSPTVRAPFRVGVASLNYFTGKFGTVTAGSGGGSLTVFADVFRIGYADTPAGSIDPVRGGSTVDFSGIVGPISIDALSMDIGASEPVANHYGRGFLDLSGTTNLSLNVGKLTIGCSGSAVYYGIGELRLGPGTGTVGTVNISGDAQNWWGIMRYPYGVLVTHGTRLQVTNTFTIGAYGTVTNFIGGSPAGLDIANNSSLALRILSTNYNPTSFEERGMNIIFTANPSNAYGYAVAPGVPDETSANCVHWGLRWAGNQTNKLTLLFKGVNGIPDDADGRQRWDDRALTGEFAGKVRIFYDPGLGTPWRPYDTTYIGFYTMLMVSNTGPPVVMTHAVSNVTATGACLDGYLYHTGGLGTVVRVYWGAGEDRGRTREGWGGTNEWSGAATGAYCHAVSGLAPNVTYTYRYYATNSAGESWGDAVSFLIPPQLPEISTLPASDVRITSAVLNGNLTTGGTARVLLYWGTTDAWPSQNGWLGTNDFGTVGNGNQTLRVTELTSGQTYVYRYYATNANGEAWGQAIQFAPGTTGMSTWDGGAGDDDNWSASLNWAGDVIPANPTPGTIVFGAPDAGKNNIVNYDWQVGGMSYQAAGVTNRHTTLLAGNTLNVTGTVAISTLTLDIENGRMLAGDVNVQSGRLATRNVLLRTTNSVIIAGSAGVSNEVGSVPGGFELLSAGGNALQVGSTIGSGGGLTVVFTGMPAVSRPGTLHWGLRWAGNHTNELEALRCGADGLAGNTDDKLRWNGSGLGEEYDHKVRIIYDPGSGTAERPYDTTYVGFFISSGSLITIE